MGVKSIEHMSKLASDLRASMPTQSEHQPLTNADFGENSGRTGTPSRAGTGASMRRTPGSSVTRRTLRGHGESEMQTLERDYEEVKVRYEDLLKQNETLKTDTRRRMESYIRRESKYKAEIAELRDELRRATAGLAGGGENTVMAPLHQMHGQILDGLSGLQDKTKAVLQEQESDLLRAFRARLYDVQMELEAERSKKDDGALEWIERTRTLGKELDWSREEALRLDRTNQQLSKENQRLRNQAKAQEDDRQFLLRQLVGLKKENAKLRDQRLSAQNSTLDAVLGPSTSNLSSEAARPSTSAGLAHQPPHHPPRPLFGSAPGTASAPAPLRPSTSGGAPAGAKLPRRGSASDAAAQGAMAEKARDLQLRLQETEKRSADVVAKLKKMLEAERRALRALRATHTRELQSRTELEVFLRQCIADVKSQLAEARNRTDLQPGERQRVLELMLSQDRVVSLLYDKTFPHMPAAQSEFQGDMLAGGSASPDGSQHESVSGGADARGATRRVSASASALGSPPGSTSGALGR